MLMVSDSSSSRSEGDRELLKLLLIQKLYLLLFFVGLPKFLVPIRYLHIKTDELRTSIVYPPRC